MSSLKWTFSTTFTKLSSANSQSLAVIRFFPINKCRKLKISTVVRNSLHHFEHLVISWWRRLSSGSTRGNETIFFFKLLAKVLSKGCTGQCSPLIDNQDGPVNQSGWSKNSDGNKPRDNGSAEFDRPSMWFHLSLGNTSVIFDTRFATNVTHLEGEPLS